MRASDRKVKREAKQRDDNSADHATSISSQNAYSPAWTGIMKGEKLEIALAATILILPMVILSALLILLVWARQMPNHHSTYSYRAATDLPLGSAYFVDFSATTLVYIASLSSTVAAPLLSAAMILFSYSIAGKMARKSDRDEITLLPSPYQLELLIRIIDGRLTALYSCVRYIFGSKQRRMEVVSILLNASAMFVALVSLA